MFDKFETSELLSFLNSILRLGKVKEFEFFYNDALDELRRRNPVMAKLYVYKTSFKDTE